MSERMTPISIEKLLLNITQEYAKYNTVFGVKKAYRQKEKTALLFSMKRLKHLLALLQVRTPSLRRIS